MPKRQQEQQQQAELDALATKPVLVTMATLLQRFTPNAQMAIFTAEQQDVEVTALLDLLAFYQEFNLRADMVSQGLDVLMSKELLNEKRKREILTDETSLPKNDEQPTVSGGYDGPK